jgi:hypothetical protein
MLVESQVLHSAGIQLLNTVSDLILKPSPIQIPRHVLWDCITFQHVKIYLLKSDNDIDSSITSGTENSTLFYANVMLQTLYALYSQPQTTDQNVLDAVEGIVNRYWDSFEKEHVKDEFLDEVPIEDELSGEEERILAKKILLPKHSSDSFASFTTELTPNSLDEESTLSKGGQTPKLPHPMEYAGDVEVLDLTGGTIDTPEKLNISHTDSIIDSSNDEFLSVLHSSSRLAHKDSVYFDAEEKLETVCNSLDNVVLLGPKTIENNTQKWLWKLFP